MSGAGFARGDCLLVINDSFYTIYRDAAVIAWLPTPLELLTMSAWDRGLLGG